MGQDHKNEEKEVAIAQSNKIELESQIQEKQLKPVQFKLSTDMIDKIRCFCYWERITHQAFFHDLVNNFFKEKNLQDIPESVKNRYKAGRKKKF